MILNQSLYLTCTLFILGPEKHIKNVENYLYGTMQNLFGVWWNKQAAREYGVNGTSIRKVAVGSRTLRMFVI
ncbi:hypothetical protein [Loigolactobacillus bifermentans]|uniref:hypothetical protein n=1 Tax=Loigolactobacillus bifermentans TaxID=1607 RepID=UPI0030840ACE